MAKIGGKVAVIGHGFSEISRSSDKSALELGIEACLNAINDAGIKPSDIDGICTNASTGEYVPGVKVIPRLETAPINYLVDGMQLNPPEWYVDHSPVGLHGMFHGSLALMSGACKYVLAYKVVHRNKSRGYGEWPDTMRYAEGDESFHAPYGWGNAIQWQANYYRVYMHKYNLKPEQLGWVAITMAKNSLLNDHAIRRKPLTMEEYLSGKMICDPVRIWDCDMPLDGAAAYVLTTSDRAKHTKNKPAYVQAFAYGENHGPFERYTWQSEGAKNCAKQLYRETGLKPSDISCAMPYDGFAMFVPGYMEAFGLVPEGQALPFLEAGGGLIGGKVPINTNGGSLSEGRLHGLGQAIEGYLQMSGRAGKRQVPNPRACVMTTNHLEMAHGVILTSEEKI
jgi:acetyl-CoA acetyltransferase